MVSVPAQPSLLCTFSNIVADGREKWNGHADMVKIVSVEPSFDKSRRYEHTAYIMLADRNDDGLFRPHITRVERYEATLGRLHRIIELRDKHNWSREQVGKAVTLGDEPHPFSLHHLGVSYISSFHQSHHLMTVKRLNPSSKAKALLSFSQSTAL